MPRWLRVMRGMVGTGMAFSVVGGLVGSLFGVPMWLSGEIAFESVIAVAARLAAVSFLLGLAFSGVLAVTARGRTLEKLSLRRVTAIGAGIGLLYFLFIGVNNGFRVWSVENLLINLAILTLSGGGSAAAILLLARRAVATRADDEPAVQGR